MTRNSEWMNHIVNHLNRMVDNFERAVMNYRPMLDGERFMTGKEIDGFWFGKYQSTCTDTGRAYSPPQQRTWLLP